jgi:hypothetical protein
MSSQKPPVRLSYSSLSTLQSCQQKYYHYKIASTPNDSDYEESEALGFGKAFHEVLEITSHRSWDETLLLTAMEAHDVDISEKFLLEKMLEKYVEYHLSSGLKVVKCELPIETTQFIGFIDFIATEGNGYWIGDLKTAARHDESLLPRLPRDMQMNLYAHFADKLEIAIPELVGKKFLGCRYRQVIKSKAKTAKGLESGVSVYDIEIPVSVMDPDGAWSIFQEQFEVVKLLVNGEAPKRNYSACFNYFRPCQYFSKCHGKNFSKNGKEIRVHTIEDYEEGLL